jgi:hypothetical protein
MRGAGAADALGTDALETSSTAWALAGMAVFTSADRSSWSCLRRLSCAEGEEV